MKRKLPLIAVSALTVAAVVVGGVAALGATKHNSDTSGWARFASAAHGTTAQAAGGAVSGGHTLVVYAHTVRNAFVDVGPVGDSPGDFNIFEENIYSSQAMTHKVGEGSVRCELRITTYSCTATLLLNGRGKVDVQSTFFANKDSTLSIVGGTGEFHSASGQLTVADLGHKNSRLTFHIFNS